MRSPGVALLTGRVRPKRVPFRSASKDMKLKVWDFVLGCREIPRAPGGGVLNKVLYEEAPPRGPTRYPFI